MSIGDARYFLEACRCVIDIGLLNSFTDAKCT